MFIAEESTTVIFFYDEQWIDLKSKQTWRGRSTSKDWLEIKQPADLDSLAAIWTTGLWHTGVLKRRLFILKFTKAYDAELALII